MATQLLRTHNSNEIELNNIRKYINGNPIKWEYDNHYQYE